MAKIRGLTGLKASEAVSVLNALRLDMLKLKAGQVFHAEVSDSVDGYASTEEEAVDVVNALVASFSAHQESVCSAVTGLGAHLVQDSTNLVTAPVATDLASAITRANDLKAKANLHFASAVFHCVADSTNSVSASNATDLPSLITLLDDSATALNGHYEGSFTSEAIEVVDP